MSEIIATVKTIKALPAPSAMDRVRILYKDTDSIRIDDIADLLETVQKAGAVLSLDKFEDRNDMLVLLGAFLQASEDEVLLVDPTLPVPRRFAGRVTKAEKPAPPKKKKKAKPAEKPAEEEGDAQEAPVPAEESAADALPSDDFGMNAPETGEPEEKPDDDGMDESEKKLFDMIGIRSEDIGYMFGTDFLMTNILRIVAENRTDEEVEGHVLDIRGGDRIWEKMKDRMEEIRALAKD